jgi:aldehyde dehydrogenase (NAD+)
VVTAAPILSERRSYVAGTWIEGDEGLPVENPADESHVTDVSITPLKEVERAIKEARRSFDDGRWADRPAAERAAALRTFLDFIEQAHEPLVATMVVEAGQPTRFAEMSQLVSGLALARSTIDLYLTMPHEEANPVPVDDLVRGRVALSIRRHEPVGVVTAITPYNAALLMALQKIIPALIAGNSVIVRPSPLTPISSLVLGAAAETWSLSPGRPWSASRSWPKPLRQ